MDSEEKKESRRGKRIAFSKDILVDNSMLFKSIDISEGGLYIYTDYEFKQNSVINVTIPFEDKKLTLKARVQHNQPGIGIGLKFIDMDNEQGATLKKLVKSIMDESVKLLNNIKRRKVLLAESNETSRQMHKNKFFMEGFSIIEARDGVEAIKLLKEQIPDLIILDRLLGKIDGYKVLLILKANPAWKDIPVIVLSDRVTYEVMEEIIHAGADECLFKIVTSPSKLTEIANVLLQRRDITT